MSKINPTYFLDMQLVFQTERNKSDSERYIEKLKNCEDTIIKSPTNLKNAIYEWEYEKEKMIFYQTNLKYKKKMKKTKNTLFDKIKSISIFSKKSQNTDNEKNK